MSRISRLVVIACITVLFPALALTQAPSESLFPVEQETLARGFDPQKVFAFGEIDSINTFNGNLNVNIPLGGSYSTGGGFSYGLQLAYNSHLWDFDTRFDFSLAHCSISEGPRGRAVTRAWPALDSNAGMGWKVSLGELYGPNGAADWELAVHKADHWMYIAPDGSRHYFWRTLHGEEEGIPNDADGVWYTRDGSFLRLKGSENQDVVTLEFPDGSVHEFEKFDDHFNVYRVRKLMDRREAIRQNSGNYLQVTYSADGLQWTLTDSASRQHVVHFMNPESEAGSSVFYDRLIDYIELTKFGGGTATYRFKYRYPLVRRTYKDDDPETQDRIRVALLEEIEFPEALTYRARYNEDLSDGQYSGRVTRVRLPTGGHIEWDYGVWIFPTRRPCSGPSPCTAGFGEVSHGVRERRLYKDAAAENPAGVWTYAHQLVGEPSACTQQYESKTTVTDPLGNKTHNYYSVLTPRAGGLNPVGRLEEYGLPFTRRKSDPAGRHFLSTEQLDSEGKLLRATYVRYAMDQKTVVQLDGRFPDNHRRVVSTRTDYLDDDQPSYSETTFSDYDGLGNYRREQTGGDFPLTGPAGVRRIRFTNYNPGAGRYCGEPSVDPDCDRSDQTFVPPPAGDAWILGTYQDSWVDDGSDRATTLSCFDPATGSLLGERQLVARSSPGPNDILASYDYDAKGNRVQERFFGGDGAGLSPQALCKRPSGDARYRVDHTYACGTLATSRVMDDCDNSVVLQTVSNVVDCRSGLIASTTDPAGVTTSFDYDALGRMTWRKPADSAWTEYVYLLPPNQLPKIVTRARQPSGGAPGPALTKTTEIFDRLGRPVSRREWIPNPGGGTQTARTNTVYNILGWVKKVSTTGIGAPAHWTTYDHDGLGRVTSTKAPDGGLTVNQYFGEREVRRTFSVDGVPSTTRERRDVLGRLVQVTEPSGPSGSDTTTFYGYDYADRLTHVTIAGTNQGRSFVYDRRGFLKEEKHPELGVSGSGRLVYSGFDARGRPSQKSVVGGSALRYRYDHLGRTTQVEDATTERLLAEYFYAGSNAGPDLRAGKLVAAKRHNYITDPELGQAFDLVVTDAFTYAGPDGRLSEQRLRSTSGVSFFQRYEYDLLGNVSEVHYPICDRGLCSSAVGPLRRVTYDYLHGKVVSVTDSLAGVLASEVSYHPNGMLFQLRHGNGVIDTQQLDSTGMTRPASIAFSGGNVSWSSGAYGYDDAGNVTKVGNDVYHYDKVSRLTSGRVSFPGGSSSQELTYDRLGNITSLRSGGVGGAIGVDARTNRLTMPGTSYDADGNLVTRAGSSFTFDPLNRMSQRQAVGESKAFLYDSRGNRVATLDLQTGHEHWTIRGANERVLREFDKDSDGVTWDKDYVLRGQSTLASISQEGVRHFHLDHLGSTRVVSDASGSKVAEYVYYPFGQLAFESGEDALLFTGHERDRNGAGAKDDLDYMLARFYSPDLSRFLSVDPVLGSAENPQGWNRYAYAGNNPLRMVDSDGREEHSFKHLNFAFQFNVTNPGLGTPILEGSGTRVDGGYVLNFNIQTTGTRFDDVRLFQNTVVGDYQAVMVFSDEVIVSSTTLSDGQVLPPSVDPVSFAVGAGSGRFIASQAAHMSFLSAASGVTGKQLSSASMNNVSKMGVTVPFLRGTTTSGSTIGAPGFGFPLARAEAVVLEQAASTPALLPSVLRSVVRSFVKKEIVNAQATKERHTHEKK